MTPGGRDDGAAQYEVPLGRTLALSFQRHPCPGSGVLRDRPRSWGVLPVQRTGAAELHVPVPAGEAVWVGVVAAHGSPGTPVQVTAVLEPGGRVDALTGRPADPDGGSAAVVPPLLTVSGVPRGDGTWWALTRAAPSAGAPACAGLEIRTGGAPAQLLRVRLVDPAALPSLATAIEPLDPAAPYQGRRLP